jgi:hypothetical protein
MRENPYVEQAYNFLLMVTGPGDVVELRMPKLHDVNGRTFTMAGFFDHEHLREMAEAAVKYNRFAEGVYFTLQRLDPGILAQAPNKFRRAATGKSAGDNNVIRLCWLLVDVDPKRATGISATDGEKTCAREKVAAVQSYLQSLGWPDPVRCDSGNGYHLLYRLDLATEEKELVKRCLQALAAKFDDKRVEIDTRVWNPSRICKLPGTWARKGEDVADRPHRLASMIEAPAELLPVPSELLEALADELQAKAAPKQAPAPSANGQASGHYSHRLDVGRWLTDRGRKFRVKDQAEGNGRTVFVLAECPFDPSHADPDSCIMQAPSGELSAQCFHNSCQGRGWQEFKAKIGKPDPNHYDPPLQARGESKPNKGASVRPVLRCLADVQAEEVEWLWPGRIPLGKLTLIVGDPGLGKSFLTLDIAARVSRGDAWPDVPGIPTAAGEVVLLNAEDGLHDQIAPRLAALGADPNKVHSLPAVRLSSAKGGEEAEVHFSLATHLHALEQAILDLQACRLVIIDPLSAYLGNTDSHNNAEVRGLLAPLESLAARRRVAIVCVTHLNKNAGGPPIQRIMGSVGFSAAPRAIWGVMRDPADGRRRLFLPVKNNLTREVPGLAYTVETAEGSGAGVVVWQPGRVVLTAQEAMEADPEAAEREGLKKDSDSWLLGELPPEGRPVAEILKTGAPLGYGPRTLQRALHRIRGRRARVGPKGIQTWFPPGSATAEDATPPPPLSHVSHVSHSPKSQDFQRFSRDATDATDATPKGEGAPLSSGPETGRNGQADKTIPY